MDGKWLTYYEWLNVFRKTRSRIVGGGSKVSETPFVQGNQYSKKYLFVMDRDSSKNDRVSVSDPFTNKNHAPNGQLRNNSYSTNC